LYPGQIGARFIPIAKIRQAAKEIAAARVMLHGRMRRSVIINLVIRTYGFRPNRFSNSVIPSTYGFASMLGSAINISFTVPSLAQFMKVGMHFLQRTANLWQQVGSLCSIKRNSVPCMGHVN
jgi:hypothetical protein